VFDQGSSKLPKLPGHGRPMTPTADAVAPSLDLRIGGVLMSRLIIVLALALSLHVGIAHAARPISGGTGVDSSISSSELKVTPEMWFYEQNMRMYKDPKMAVRANAEYRSVQRQHRIASMKWFGFSNSRPRASSDPFHGDYSPSWVSNPGYYPSRWNGVGQMGTN
jgi:hypothetical protein